MLSYLLNIRQVGVISVHLYDDQGNRLVQEPELTYIPDVVPESAIIVDDIYDTGKTYSAIINRLKLHNRGL